MPDPDGLFDLIQIAQQVQSIVPGDTGEGLVTLGIHLFHIHQQQIGHSHKRLKFGEKGLRLCKGVPGGINAGVDALRLCLGEQLQQKVRLQQRFPAADGNAPLPAPVAPAAQGLFQQLVGGAAVGAGVVQVPGVRVVAEFAALGAAL